MGPRNKNVRAAEGRGDVQHLQGRVANDVRERPSAGAHREVREPAPSSGDEGQNEEGVNFDPESDDESWRDEFAAQEAEAIAELDDVLDATPVPVGSMSDVADIFAADGPFALAFPGYQPRPSQVKMAKACADIANRGGVILIDAPTGVGKSVAYLVPAIRWATLPSAPHEGAQRYAQDTTSEDKEEAEPSNPRAVVIATANIALQEQLVSKDLPALQRILPWRFTFAIAKGINNYFCQRNYAETQNPMSEPLLGFDAVQLERLKDWSKTTVKGDLSEFTEELTPRVRLNVTTNSQECSGKKCEYAGTCFARKARAEFRRADVVVTNYHLLLANVNADFHILPPYRGLVLDEFHQLSDIARDTFGGRASPGTFIQAGRRCLPRDSELREELANAVQLFFDELRHYVKTDNNDGMLDENDPIALTEPLSQLADVVRRVSEAITDRLQDETDMTESERMKIGAAGNTLADAVTFLSAAMRASVDKNQVFFVDQQGEGATSKIALCSRIVDPSKRLRETIFERPDSHFVIGTSATLASGPDDFDQAIRDTGAVTAYELEVKSPFDLAKQALLVVPEKLPNPAKFDEFTEQCAALFVQAVKLAGGRTLGLFTSWRGATAAAARLRREWRDHEILLQGEAPRMQLIKRFREQVGSVLIGTASLWEGVDVPGEALSCVVMDKLPFPHIKDPVMRRLEEIDPKGVFMKQSIPRATRAFRQGFGRLIRSETDRGVVVCLDRRLVEKGYGKKFLKAITGVPLSRNMGDIAKYLGP
jgi:ATP-dependent DNA helicase DinG